MSRESRTFASENRRLRVSERNLKVLYSNCRAEAGSNEVQNDMKIGILTLALHVNYGGILQAYALQTVLERMGHEVRVVNSRWLDIMYRRPALWRLPLCYAKRIVKKIFIDHSKAINREGQLRREYRFVSQHTQSFIDKYVHSHYVLSPEEIAEGTFDAFVVGSDQIWRPRYIPGRWGADKTVVFLGFTRDWNVKRFAYAASFGVDEWEFPTEHGAEYAALAQAFDAISVREDSGVALCRDHLGVEAQHVLDPTMLLSPEDYRALINASGVPAHDGDMFCYILDRTEAKMGLADAIARERGLKAVHMTDGMMLRDAPLNERVHAPVESWLRGFADAKFVVTDSFHGCVFSIIFGKPFVVIGNVKRGLSRMQSLLRMFHLEDHLLMDVAEYAPNKSYAQGPEVRQRLEELRQQSRAFLEKIRDKR